MQRATFWDWLFLLSASLWRPPGVGLVLPWEGLCTSTPSLATFQMASGCWEGLEHGSQPGGDQGRARVWVSPELGQSLKLSGLVSTASKREWNAWLPMGGREEGRRNWCSWAAPWHAASMALWVSLLHACRGRLGRGGLSLKSVCKAVLVCGATIALPRWWGIGQRPCLPSQWEAGVPGGWSGWVSCAVSLLG